MTSGSNAHAAFISNANDGEADRRWAEWLHHALSRYSIPREVSERLETERKLGSIYWDHESSQLKRPNRTLLDEIARSGVLLVVCSPHARASEWVNDETRHFLESNGPAKLIPVLIEGRPETAYPPALVSVPDDEQPMRVDLRHARGWRASLDRERELVKIIEGILGCAAGELREGHLRRERKRTRVVTAVGALGLMVLGVATSVAWRAKTQSDEMAASLQLALTSANTSANDARRRVKILQVAADAATLSALEAEAVAMVTQGRPSADDVDRWLADVEPVLERAEDAIQLVGSLPLQGPEGDLEHVGMDERRFVSILHEYVQRAARLNGENGLKARLEGIREAG